MNSEGYRMNAIVFVYVRVGFLNSYKKKKKIKKNLKQNLGNQI